MGRAIELEAILAPLAGDNPAGVDMRYQPLYDEIKEARRADDLLDRGDWQRELKTADWDKVITLSLEALTQKSKDLQIAAWLLEALIRSEGFPGVEVGLAILIGLVEGFWDHLYPEAEDGDLDYRCGPLEFVNDKLAILLKEIPLTDAGVSPGHSWHRWQEATKVGKEADLLNKWGDVDEGKKKARDLFLEEGKLTGEEFDAAVRSSSRAYYEQLMQLVQSCQDKFQRLDSVVDEKFGNAAPRLSDFKASLEECVVLVKKLLKEKRSQEPDPELDRAEEPVGGSAEVSGEWTPEAAGASPLAGGFGPAPGPAGGGNVNRLLGSGGMEEIRWREALAKLKAAGIEAAVELLLGAACSAQSPRERANYQLLLAKLCLQEKRPELARPIAEQLAAQMEELQLVRWESPIWIAEVLDLLYRCLMVEGASDEERYRAQDILKKICTTDITKAMKHRN